MHTPTPRCWRPGGAVNDAAGPQNGTHFLDLPYKILCTIKIGISGGYFEALAPICQKRHALGAVLGFLQIRPRQYRPCTRVRQTVAARIAFETREQRPGSVPELVFEFLGMPAPMS